MQWHAFYVALHLLVAGLYVLLAWRAWVGLQTAPGATSQQRALWLTPLIAAGHALLLGTAVIDDGVMHFGFAHALSATLLFAVLIVWAEGFLVPVRGLLVFVLPTAAVAAVLPALFQGSPIAAATDTPAFRVHLLTAIAAFSLITIAAAHAMLMASMDRALHAGSGVTEWRRRVLAEVPPLLAMERLLFRLIGIGFVLLTLTLVSGIFFSEALFGRALRFEHKSIFTIASWLVFAGLLAGRQFFGWRGRTALRWTLAGFVMLLLAYVGSRFVLEVILQRV
ncbi:MAG TPA: cytochrome c biogenesis protein CcsA [Burkholderiaceae bacterium]|nr:cytochrome c biogenesis protein CcsA [Burkholderiaceae bacterium]